MFNLVSARISSENVDERKAKRNVCPSFWTDSVVRWKHNPMSLIHGMGMCCNIASCEYSRLSILLQSTDKGSKKVMIDTMTLFRKF